MKIAQPKAEKQNWHGGFIVSHVYTHAEKNCDHPGPLACLPIFSKDKVASQLNEPAYDIHAYISF